jgi:alpha-mannosidase
MIGNAHLDPVWLWPWEAGADEAVATFRAAADICDAYPEFVFTRGEAWLYERVEELDPELYARVRELVRRGQWHVIGGQYVQPDCNLISEIGWQEQFRRGRQYFDAAFGVRSTLAYNVDSFGHPATLPDILSAHGYRGYLFHRPRPEQVPLEAQTFLWRGTGGGEVIGFRIIPGYNAKTEEIEGRVAMALEAADPRIGHAMCFYGVGNHGGGPTRESVEWILEHREAIAGVELRFSTPEAYFDAVEPLRDLLPVVTTELQQVFPGCYSVMHEIKQRQQRVEAALARAAQALSVWGSGDDDHRRLAKKIETAWDDALFTSFHDILAGTSIPSAWESVRAMQGRAHIEAEEAAHQISRHAASTTLAPDLRQRIVVMNPTPDDWAGYVEAEPNLYFDKWGDRWLSDRGGNLIEHQTIQPEAHLITSRVLFPISVAAGGIEQVFIRHEPRPEQTQDTSALHASAAGLGNGSLEVGVGETSVTSLTANGREFLGAGGMRLILREDMSDTWGQEVDVFDGPIVGETHDGTWTVDEDGPLRARTRLDCRLGDSRIRWTLSVPRSGQALEMDLDIVFVERFATLQLILDLPQPILESQDGAAGGSVTRHPERLERPVLGWSNLTLEDSQLAVATNDAWSRSAFDSRWQWTLLRSPKMAWYGGRPIVYSGRDVHTDQGEHHLSFLLLPGHDLGHRELAQKARELFRPIITHDRYDGMASATPHALHLDDLDAVGA